MSHTRPSDCRPERLRDKCAAINQRAHYADGACRRGVVRQTRLPVALALARGWVDALGAVALSDVQRRSWNRLVVVQGLRLANDGDETRTGGPLLNERNYRG
ncbi:hypothetical protein MTO96_028700 [Rhipicephalus appendiculatus]